jgi:hypothetical protein
MASYSVPVGQQAYQTIFVKKFAAAIKPFAQTANRYGGGSAAYNSAANALGTTSTFPLRCGRRLGFVQNMGNAEVPNAVNGVQSAGATGFVVNDLVTLQVNGGRPLIVKVLAVAAGNPTQTTVIDGGGGIDGADNGINLNNGQGHNGPITLTQIATSGVGVTGVWTIIAGAIPYGWTFPQPNPLA